MYYYYKDQESNIDKITGKNGSKVEKTVKKASKSVTKAVKSETINVEHITEDVRLLRRFYACLGKERKHGTILTIYRDFERRITERKVNRERKHGDLVWQCNKKLSTLLNEMTRQDLTHVKLEVDKEFGDKLKAAANEVAVRSSVNLLKRFIGIEGEVKPDKAKVKRIYDAFNQAAKKGRIGKSDFYAHEMVKAAKAMRDYLNDKTDHITVDPTTLSGLGLGKLNAFPISLDGTAQSKDTISFNKAMIMAKREGFKSYDVFKLGITKKALKDIIGETQMFLSGAVLRKIMQKDKDHSLLWHNLINLPDSINNPAAIFQSKSKGYVVLTEIRNYRNKPVMAAIQINEKIEIVDIKSMYAKTRTSIYRKWENEGLLLYKNNKSNLVKSTLAPVASSTPKSLCQNKGTKTSKKSNLSGIENEPIVVSRFQVDISQPEPAGPIQPEIQVKEDWLSGLFTPITHQPAESSHEKTRSPEHRDKIKVSCRFTISRKFILCVDKLLFINTL